jgi:hypothetical protein
MQKRRPYLNKTNSRKAIRIAIIRTANKSVKAIIKAIAKAIAEVTY